MVTDTTETAWERVCVLCAAAGKERKLEAGHCCESCATWLHTAIVNIGFYATEAAAWVAPGSSSKGGGSASFGSKPPINVDAVDPELAFIELNAGDRSSAVTILEMLEMWERSIREDRGFTQYGPASSQRAIAKGVRMLDSKATLIGCVDFLAGQVEWIITAEDFGLEELADHVRRAAAILRRWDGNSEQIGTRIACPAQVDDHTCGTTLRISNDGTPVTCRGCGHSWTIDWLIRVAGNDADGWADIEAVARLSGLHERTIRRWASAGKVRKRGLLYNVRDISEATTKEISA